MIYFWFVAAFVVGYVLAMVVGLFSGVDDTEEDYTSEDSRADEALRTALHSEAAHHAMIESNERALERLDKISAQQEAMRVRLSEALQNITENTIRLCARMDSSDKVQANHAENLARHATKLTAIEMRAPTRVGRS